MASSSKENRNPRSRLRRWLDNIFPLIEAFMRPLGAVHPQIQPSMLNGQHIPLANGAASTRRLRAEVRSFLNWS